MGIESIIKTTENAGRKLISYVTTDPIGEGFLLTGGYLIKTDAAPTISIPITIAGVYHIITTIRDRRKLKESIKECGWNRKVIKTFCCSSWCTNQMTRAYSFGERKYGKFKDILEGYSLKHHGLRYIKKTKDRIKTIKEKIKLIL